MFNLRSFTHDMIFVKFKKLARKSLDKLLICKEDKEHITKSKIALITQLFSFLNSLDENSLLTILAKIENKSEFSVFEFAI